MLHTLTVCILGQFTDVTAFTKRSSVLPRRRHSIVRGSLYCVEAMNTVRTEENISKIMLKL